MLTLKTTDFVPLAEFRSKIASFFRISKNGRPVIISKNGRAESALISGKLLDEFLDFYNKKNETTVKHNTTLMPKLRTRVIQNNQTKIENENIDNKISEDTDTRFVLKHVGEIEEVKEEIQNEFVNSNSDDWQPRRIQL